MATSMDCSSLQRCEAWMTPLELAAKAAYEYQCERWRSEIGESPFPQWDQLDEIHQAVWTDTVKAALTKLQPSDILEIKEAMV